MYSGVQQATLQELERVRLVRLERDVQWHLPRTAQQRWALESCDVKASPLPFDALPTPGQCISNLQYTEGAAKYLGVDSPLCAGRVGEAIAGKLHRGSDEPWLVDRYGNNIYSVQLEDQFRTRHDGVKLVIPRVARWAGVHCVVEVYGHLVFSGLLSQNSNGPWDAMAIAIASWHCRWTATTASMRCPSSRWLRTLRTSWLTLSLHT